MIYFKKPLLTRCPFKTSLEDYVWKLEMFDHRSDTAFNFWKLVVFNTSQGEIKKNKIYIMLFSLFIHTFILALDMEHVSFQLHQDVIIGKIQWFVFSWENQLRQQTFASLALFGWFSWQNRSHYLVYPHGNLTVHHVTYIFSTDSGLRQASEETQPVGEFSGSQKFAWCDQDKSVMPCSLWM